MTIGSQAPYTVLVANLDVSAMPERGINAHKIRTGFRMSPIQTMGNELVGEAMSPLKTSLATFNAYADGAPTRPTATVTVANNTFSGDSARLFVGPYTIVSNVHFTPGGGVNATATALAAAVDALPEYTAAAVGAVVTVQGPISGLSLRFQAEYVAGNKNYSFSWPTNPGFLGYLSNPPLLGPVVLP